jgi:hypothetical protein
VTIFQLWGKLVECDSVFQLWGKLVECDSIFQLWVKNIVYNESVTRYFERMYILGQVKEFHYRPEQARRAAGG